VKKTILAALLVTTTTSCSVIRVEPEPLLSPQPINISITLQIEEADRPVVQAASDPPAVMEKIVTKIEYVSKPVCTHLKDIYSLEPFTLEEISLNGEADRLRYLKLLIDRVNLVDGIIAGANNNVECRKQLQK
jgi:hypothetical protein